MKKFLVTIAVIALVLLIIGLLLPDPGYGYIAGWALIVVVTVLMLLGGGPKPSNRCC